MRNYKARGALVQDGLRKQSSKTSIRAAEQSSDSEVEAIVNEGVHTAYTVAEKTIRDNCHPFAISFLLSLSQDQMKILQEKQLRANAAQSKTDTLFLCDRFQDTLCEVQQKLLKESKLWVIQRRQIIKKTPLDIQID